MKKLLASIFVLSITLVMIIGVLQPTEVRALPPNCGEECGHFYPGGGWLCNAIPNQYCSCFGQVITCADFCRDYDPYECGPF